MNNHYMLLLFTLILFPSITSAISCLEYQVQQEYGTVKRTDTIRTPCSNGTTFCVRVYREANDETLQAGECADPTATTTTCNVAGCTKTNESEEKTETCCCDTDYCNTEKTNGVTKTSLPLTVVLIFTMFVLKHM